jgi:leucyl aminopeptidase
MSEPIIASSSRSSEDGAPTPIHCLYESELAAFVEARPSFVKGFVALEDFKAKAGQVLVLPTPQGVVDRVLLGLGQKGKAEAMLFRALPGKLPGALARDMVNTPANDMGPLQIETIAREIAERYGATLDVISGDDLLDQNYPAVHAVGRAAVPARAPRMLEITWGDAGDPRLAIIGKGVVFDTGGLDIKPSGGMRLMKKDMGGAAHALALARMVMAAGLPVALSVLVPVVENAIAGDAMRPGDVLATRAGLTVEVGNTDAEGRLILADALTRAAELEPVLTIDMATLTGAARVALGPQVIPFYTPDDDLALEIEEGAREASDPVWRMPLWDGYREAVERDIPDHNNDPDAGAQAGSMTAALFLQRFAPTTGSWVHFDIFAWNPKQRPGFASGGEAQVIRGLYGMLKSRFPKASA